MAYDRKSRTEIVIEEFVLVNNERKTTYIEENVTIQPISIGKKGPVYKVVTEDGIEMGIIRDGKKLVKTDDYEKHLIEKLGISNYKLLALDSSNIEADVQELMKKQRGVEEQQKQREHERQRQQQQVAKEAEEVAKANEEKEENEKADSKEPVKGRTETIAENSGNNSKDNKKLVLTKKELGQHQFAVIRDREFARKLVPDLDKYNFYGVCVVMVDGYPKVMAQRNDNLDQFEELPEYMGAKTEMGQIDSLENGEEIEDIKKGDVITMLDRNGNRVKIDARITSGGEMEVRDVTKDMDGDNDNEGVRIETRTYTPAKPAASKIAGKDLTNEEKEKQGIETEEINDDDPLTNAQIKEMLDESEISDLGIGRVIERLPDQIKKAELQELIDQELARDEEDKEIEEEKEADEPGVYYSHGIKMFRGRPAE